MTNRLEPSFYLSRENMNFLKPDYFFDLRDYEHDFPFDECHYVWEALSLIEKYLKTMTLGKIEVDIPSGVFLEDPDKITIGSGTVVEPGSYIKGPVLIGKRCTIRQGAYIRGGVIAGNDCVIGHGTEAKNALLLNNAHAAHFAYLGDSILGNNVNLGAGTVCANLRLDREEIAVRYGEARIKTGRRKIGAIIGDRTQIGCHTVLNPGTLIGKDVCGYPSLNFGGFIPSKSIVKSEASVSVAPMEKSQ